ncbi:MAG: hypothetical protein Q4B26_14110 [Eubacteriales bacterium]|nr:hypothetical protein [Eubacteriales bacterium]
MRTKEEIASCERMWGIDYFDADNFTGWIKLPDCGTCSVVCSMGTGSWTGSWEHVSVSPRKKFDKLGRENLPTWNDMCVLKNIFWNDEEEAYQIHPKKSEYVNIQTNCLHLWKPIGRELGELIMAGTSR